jgi:hypothetical protein
MAARRGHQQVRLLARGVLHAAQAVKLVRRFGLDCRLSLGRGALESGTRATL